MSEHPSRRRVLVAVTALSGFLVGYLAPGLVAQAGTCITDVYHVIGQNGSNGRGVRAVNPGMQVSNTTVTCLRISSISVVGTIPGRWVEVGWYEDPADVLALCPTTSGTPKILMYASYDYVGQCNPAPPTVAAGTYDFYTHDDNQNGVWVYFWNAQSLGSFNVGTLTSGVQRAQGERREDDDSAYSNFEVLKKMNSSMGWQLWAAAFVAETYDPAYRGCFYGPTHFTVKLGTC